MLDRLQKASLIIEFINKLKEKGSWCGETHIQKATYFLQGLTGVPLDFEFILYKHGPFSFDLRDELTAMRADGLIKNEIQLPPYGPSLLPTDLGNKIHDHFPKTTKKYSSEIEFVSEYLGDKSVAELERMGTALYAILKNIGNDKSERAEEIHKLKPHVSTEEALLALNKVEGMIKELEKIKST